MAVEVRELVIRAVVSDDAAGASGGSADSREELIMACVDEVMRILERKQQR